jgi:hypothetical protein
MVWRSSRRYGLVTYPIFTTVRHIAREYKGIMCRGSPVPLCKGTGTKQLKVDYFACATCVLQFADSLLDSSTLWKITRASYWTADKHKALGWCS